MLSSRSAPHAAINSTPPVRAARSTTTGCSDAKANAAAIFKRYRKAVVRLALVGTAAEQAETLAGLNHAKQFLRHELTERLQLFKSPELYFEAALAADLAAKAAKILKRIERGRPKDTGSEKNPIS